MKLLIAIFLLSAALAAQSNQRALLPPTLRDIGIEQHLDAGVPLDTVFHDEQGHNVQLGSFFHGRPVLLIPVYYTCPMLCSQILSGVVAGLRPLRLSPGRDFEIVAFSFNPAETSADANRERDFYSHRYSTRAGTAGWHFLTGSPPSIHTLTEAIGFHYRYDPVNKIFVHASGVMILTPDGKISRYFYGVNYEPKDLKLGLIDASNRTIGSPVDQILLFCYHYDPKTGKYGAVVLNVLRGAGVLMLGCMALGLVVFWRFDLRRHKKSTEARRL
jgi:protein SCO1/2